LPGISVKFQCSVKLHPWITLLFQPLQEYNIHCVLTER